MIRCVVLTLFARLAVEAFRQRDLATSRGARTSTFVHAFALVADAIENRAVMSVVVDRFVASRGAT